MYPYLHCMAKRRAPEQLALSQRVQSLFGERLKAVRRGGGRLVSQDELAQALGVSRTSVSNIERGQHRVFLDQVFAAAHLLGVQVAELLPQRTEVFLAAEVHTAPHARFAVRSLLEATELTRQIREDVEVGYAATIEPPRKHIKGDRR